MTCRRGGGFACRDCLIAKVGSLRLPSKGPADRSGNPCRLGIHVDLRDLLDRWGLVISLGTSTAAAAFAIPAVLAIEERNMCYTEKRPLMLCKWISAVVPAASLTEFDTAQQRWSMIGDQPGLIGQVGGWDTAGVAHVLAFWRDRPSYRQFMRQRHDEVTRVNQQRDTYTSIAAAIGEVVFSLGGDAGDVPRALGEAVLMRVADCDIVPGREAHFIDMHRRVWAPAMAAAGGMLAGCCTKLEQHRYLVTTFWSDPHAHQRYTKEDVPSLQSRANVEDDLHTMAGHVLPLEPVWRVLPDRIPDSPAHDPSAVLWPSMWSGHE